MLNKFYMLRQPFAVAPLLIARSLSSLSSFSGSIISNSHLYFKINIICCCTSLSQRTSTFQNVFYRNKFTLDTSQVPVLNEDDLEEHFIRGSGPGGSNVNTNSNCVVLRHKPTGILLKCHEARLQQKNRVLARKMMIEKLDEHFNGHMSLKGQKESFLQKKGAANLQKRRKLREQKVQYKEFVENQLSTSTSLSDSVIDDKDKYK